MAETKYIFVTGGVLSSLGKGISCSSIGTLLQHSGFNVSILKIDPYINVDPGTMSPLEHGEVFVTADGAETDLDIGHYERFLNMNLSRNNNFTTGQIYLSVIEKERKGDYLGKTIQIVPHVTNEIKQRIMNVGQDSEFLIVELGGTVGDIEGMPYLEAMRQLKHELGANNVLSIHVTLVPYIRVADELKTKPTQHSVQELRRIGITPQIIIARSELPLSKDTKEKIALACDINSNSVISAEDASTIYKCPINFINQGILEPISNGLHLGNLQPDMSDWDMLVKKILSPTKNVQIGFVGKYISLKESYKSLLEAFVHAGANLDTKVEVIFIDSEHIEDSKLANVQGILVPGGFGERGIEGKIAAIRYARENNLPFLGICLGMQLAMIEFARNVLELDDCNSTEFNKHCKNPIIYMIEDFIDIEGNKQVRTHTSPLGGTMRLGEYECHIKVGSRLAKAYNDEKVIKERHRHRYEANPKYREAFEKKGLVVSGECNGLIEAVELNFHPFFVGVQFHPEFTSRLQNPNRVIVEFVKQAQGYK
ncbi:CTP synthase (glutamine hydrolyzing) [Helicobacter muridarum]|uniref:CTP synthase n=1 Tax=Helicobacter muridarum TaxID=216 RepID=A0A099TVI3_9HELI|nr:CTP synthase (glutamine hydrolyzing) [Helicobacter muridarum]TLD98917.1 CTP synthase (glutamine hydrolyzing) [Helicobacter muridarum]STQ87115.1 CTP synthetase [Helicobacter muridarum]